MPHPFTWESVKTSFGTTIDLWSADPSRIVIEICDGGDMVNAHMTLANVEQLRDALTGALLFAAQCAERRRTQRSAV